MGRTSKLLLKWWFNPKTINIHWYLFTSEICKNLANKRFIEEKSGEYYWINLTLTFKSAFKFFFIKKNIPFKEGVANFLQIRLENKGQLNQIKFETKS